MSQELIGRLHASLQKLIGFHRQLLEAVRAEKDALVQAEMRAIRETTCTKQVLVESIKLEEAARLRVVAELAAAWGKKPAELPLSQIIIETQATSRGLDPKITENLRSSLNALTLLVKRVTEQNQENSRFVERALEHVGNMKRNVLGEASPNSQTYTQQGTRSAASAGNRLISREA
ncbi:MAG: flagellar protein FlgN [Oligoflexia bacterium]|nr:flagellar protein FlgN [Oligoflexia bacterium]